MTHKPQINIHNLIYKLPDNRIFFDKLTVAFGQNKNAIIGKNGIGKSTLLKLITGEFGANSGSISGMGTIALLPQDTIQLFNQTVAATFEVEKKLEAFNKITSGSSDEKYYTILNDDWNFKERLKEQLHEFGLDHLHLEQKLNTLSGGEITRLLLVKLFANQRDFILLDEPTNNLSIKARHKLYSKINDYRRGLIVVSHDRKLLELMDNIYELSTLGIKKYGGNFSFYQTQKSLEKAATIRQFEDAKKLLHKTERSIQATREKHDQRQAQGESLRKKGDQPKMLLDKMKQDATSNQKKLKAREETMLNKANKVLINAKENIEIINEFKFVLQPIKIPNNKIILQMENITFAYDQNSKPLIKNFNLSIIGPERVAIIGEDGSGKTTLVKLIQKELTPLSGTIHLGVSNINYLDQHATSLNMNISVLENFKIFNPIMNDNDAHLFLARFLFRNSDALKLAANLSGGEKLRALLACVLMAEKSPALIILDEPTNHLDLESIATIENALGQYHGALLVISHDMSFIDNIGTQRIIQLA